MTTYVLIAGACHGGWYYEPITARLRAQGHQVHAPTLSAVGNLEEHVEQVLALVDGLEDVVLVGHSYGGMVITAVADRVPGKVKSLVYVDALVPRDGQSAWDLVHGFWRQWYIDGASADGRGVAPMPFFDKRAFAHPIASLLQRPRLTGAVDGIARRWYLYCEQTQDSPFTQFRDAFQADPGWEVRSLDVGHNFLDGGAEDFLDVLKAAG
ncbi:alpha/beta fold hydrolase [Saccharothrix variisporea]|uniref:Alpha/beta hydrolase family protein n=1 Tax=Saccharothrix variisporea TaxID=543527 RepID=A0A495XL22_9PSEU|nr:alpha/beta fold hydrolase [Saccharothrix variisporea]RKT73666.1 alpha/beta hydrolase family protein [Saccharothrix variisporea]